MSPTDVYVMTLKFDAGTFERLQALRIRHFPQTLNFIPAHLTLFHSISLEQADRLHHNWDDFKVDAPLVLDFIGLRPLGRGTALSVKSERLSSIRNHAMRVMAGTYSKQDQQTFNAHVTIQNKVTAAESKALLRELSLNFVPWQGIGTGLMIWQYLGGQWSLQTVLPFEKT